MNIIGTGLSGLVGSRIVELLGDVYTFEDISRKTGTDILDLHALEDRIKNSSAEIVLHMAAYTNVDGAEEQKDLAEKSEPWQTNVVGTENVITACVAARKKLIYFSTDFVFDGESTPQPGFREGDAPNPVNWYAKTKYEAELRVQKAACPWIIMRIAYPYRASFEKNDFFRAMKSRLETGQKITAITDHIYSPTFIDDVASALHTLIEKDVVGTFHVTGSQNLSPYDSAQLIAEIFSLDKSLISSTTREEYFQNKAKRPFDLSMNNDKIKQLGIQMKSFREGLEEIKKQIVSA